MLFEAGTYTRFKSEKVLQDIFQQLENDPKIDQEELKKAAKIVHKYLSFYLPKIKTILKIKDDGNFPWFRDELKEAIREHHREFRFKIYCNLTSWETSDYIASLARNILITKLKGI